MMVWLGSYTQPFLQPISSATAHLLDQTSMSNEYRVQMNAPLSKVAEASHAR